MLLKGTARNQSFLDHPEIHRTDICAVTVALPSPHPQHLLHRLLLPTLTFDRVNSYRVHQIIARLTVLNSVTFNI